MDPWKINRMAIYSSSKEKEMFFQKYFSCLIIIVRMIVYMNSFLIIITNERLLTN